MIGAEDVVVNLSRADCAFGKLGHEEIVNPPSGIPRPGVESIAPPAIFHLVRMQLPERINET